MFMLLERGSYKPGGAPINAHGFRVKEAVLAPRRHGTVRPASQIELNLRDIKTRLDIIA